MRLIDADELIPLIKIGEMNEYTELGEGRNGGIAYAIERIKQMPTIEPGRKKGKWISGKCDQCGEHAPYWSMSTTYYLSNYCFNCGADMRET